ncbi:MAG: LysE family translocator [Pseudomonadota bacterium]
MSNIWTEIGANWPNMVLAWTALTLVAIAPGPTAMAIMGISMQRGRGAGFLFTAGCMTGAFTWATLAGIGLSAWLTAWAAGIFLLKLAGAVYLGWMALKAFRSALSSNVLDLPTSESQRKGGLSLYTRGLLLHLTNPKAILGWAAVITLSQSGGGSIAVLVVTLAGCLIITNIIHFSYAAIFATRSAMAAYRRARRWIEGVLGGVFAFASYKLATS